MRTFTHSAKKKANQLLNLLQNYTKGIRITAMLMLLLIGTSNAWGDVNYKGGYFYFDNSLNVNKGYVMLCGRRHKENGYENWYTAVTTFNKNAIAGTKLYYTGTLEGSTWNTSTWNGWVVISDANKWNNGNFQNWTDAGWCSAYRNNYDFYANSTYVLIPTSTSKSQTIEVDYHSSYSGLNHNQTVYKYTSSGGTTAASYTAESLNSGTVTISAYKMTGNGTASNSNNIQTINAASTTSKYVSAAYTGEVTVTAEANTGYEFVGWFESTSATTAVSTNESYTYNAPNSDKSLYARFKEKTYSLTFKHDGNGTIKVGGTTISSGGTATVNHVTTKTLVATPNTGYNFTNWTLSGSNTSAVTIGNTSTASTTIKATNTGATVTANFTPKTYTITLDANGGASNGSATATYNNNAVTNATYPTRTDYRCNGYYTAASGGTLVLNIDGTLANNVSGYTDANGNWTKDDDATLYAQWTYDVTEYTVNFGAGTDFTSYGTVTAKNNSTSATITSPATVRSGQSITFTASPNTGYIVEGWYSDIDCNTSLNNGTNTTYTINNLEADKNVYVKFVEQTWSVAFAAGTGGSVTTPASTPQTVGQVTGISIAATPATGYRFTGWTSSNGGTFADASATTTTFKPTNNTTVTANFSEIKHTIQIGIEAGQESWGSVSPTSISVGQHTASANITATAKTSVGYVFDHWEISDGITIASGGVNSPTIKIKATQAGSLTAHFRGENRLQNVYLMVNSDNPADPNWQFYKLPGESGNTVTLTKTITKSDYHSNGYKFGFQIYHSDWTDQWWKNSSTGSYKMDAHSCTNWGFNTKEGDNYTYVDLNVSGEYTFTLTNSTTYNQQALSITYPDKSFIEGNFAIAWDENAYTLTENEDIQSVTIPITSKTDVEFRLVSHGKLFGTSTQILVGTNSQKLSAKNMEDDGAVMTIGAYVEGDYTFSYNKSTNVLTVEYPVINQIRFYSEQTGGSGTDTYEWENTSSTTWTKTISLNKGTHYFKVLENSEYFGNTGTMTRDNCSNWTMNNTTENCGITADVKGDYKFSYNTSTNMLSVTYPEAYTVTYSRVPEAAANTPDTDPHVTSGNYVLANTRVTFTAKDAKDGYSWKGWYNNEAGDGDALSTDKAYTQSITDNTTIYAVYTGNEYTVTFDNNGADAATPGIDSITATYGTEMPSIADNLPEKTGYHFDGYWIDKLFDNTDKKYYNNEGEAYYNQKWDIAANTTLYAKWIANTYTIIFNKNADDATGSMANQEFTYDEAQNLTPNAFERTGYHFIEWNTTAKGNGDKYSDAQEVINLNATNNGQKTLYAQWEIGTYIVTFDPQNEEATSTIEVTFGAEMPDIIPPTREGYFFDGYFANDDGTGTQYYNADGENIQNWDQEAATIYAKWTSYSDCIFFKNNLEWDNVYVYFYSSDRYWDDYYGTGSKKDKYFGNDNHSPHYREFRGEMSQIGKTDVWYVNYKELAKTIDEEHASEITGYTNIAFTMDKQYDYEWFHETQVVRRGDFNAQLPLFVPQSTKSETTNSCDYYNNGLWMKYNSKESGYDWRGATDESDEEEWNKSHNFTAEKAGGYSFTATVNFDDLSTHYFKIHNLNTTDNWFGNGGIMTQNNCTNWHFSADNNSNAQITPTITGDYVFTIYLGDGKVMVSLDYPLSTGDYRLAYKDDSHPFHPGHYIKKRSSVPEQRDTVSFFVHHEEENHPKIYLQECTAISAEGVPTWATKATYTTLGDSVTSTGVYNFILKQTNNNDTHARSVETNETHLYTGDFYIRTDATPGGWKSFRQKGNKMTYSSYAQRHENFNHYFCEWILAYTNVKFTIANDYSLCISDTLDGDDIITKEGVSVGCLPVGANVRFGWDSKTNQITRAYIAGSGHIKDRFLVLQGNENLTDANGNAFTGNDEEGQVRYGLKDHETTFDDIGNWVYQLDVTATNETKIDLIAEYNGQTQYFIGGDTEGPSYQMLASTNGGTYKIRIAYDFKTNHLIGAWLPGDEYTASEGESLGADMIISRTNQETATQLTLNNQLSNVKTVYGVMNFDKYFLNNIGEDGKALAEAKSIYERALYWVSFPFDVNLSDVFGFGEYGDTWIMEYYDGAARAKNGMWVDSDTYWTYITEPDTAVLKAGQGYVLCLDLDKMGDESSVFEHTDNVSLYFPSANEIGAIQDTETTIKLEEHTCTIERDNRNIYDSHWHLIGVPRYANIDFTIPTTLTLHESFYQQEDVGFYYAYNASNNTYDVHKTGDTTFNSMHAYLVQYTGDLTWTTTTSTPAQLAARRNAGTTKEKVNLRLEIAQGEEMADQTFIQLQQEGATAEFDMNIDLTKIINSGANIYTLAGDNHIQTAGNVLPMEKATVPVGVKITEDGEYTFRMPDGTDGISAILIDYEMATKTNLLLSNYTVNLPEGTHENRFALILDIQHTATSLEEIFGEDYEATSGANNNVHKYLINGQLIIRTADGIFDAQGHRL